MSRAAGRSRLFGAVVIAGALAAVLAALAGVNARAASEPDAKFAPGLAAALTQGDAPFLVFFDGRADVSSAGVRSDKVARRRFVYDRLREQAARSQAGARSLAERSGATYRQHYLLNMMEVTGGPALAQALAALPEVTRLAPDALASMDLPTPDPSRMADAPQAPSGIEWGVSRIHAPEVWITYSVRGEGIVVGTADTGVQWDHPALIGHYRGWNGVTATHTLNWHDAVHDSTGSTYCAAADNLVPCDGYGHGTHVTGIMVGDDGAGNQVGVAPGAQWIGCRNMDNSGTGSIARYTECFEFMLAPFPQGGNPLTDGHPELAADIVNNSWTCTPGEGCDSAHLNDLEAPIQALNAAGILVVAAAGNSGSACSSVSEPPAIYAETFTAGAIDSTDAIAGFSSRGPVTVDGSNRMKPDISAPGVSVRSTVPFSSYNWLSGTSMASPHVSGAAALLWSAVPQLRGDIAQTINALEMAADPRVTSQGCGGDSASAVPNNVFGHGVVNALEAIRCAPFGLCIAMESGAPVVHIGDVLTYTIHINNATVSTMTGVLAADRIPSGTTYLSGSIAGLGADPALAPVLQWQVGDLAPAAISGTLALSFAVQVGPGGGAFTNTARISANALPLKSSNVVRSVYSFSTFFPFLAR